MKNISLIVPLYNEKNSLHPLYESVKEEFSTLSLNLEIIFVDDGSRDGSFEVLKELQEVNPRIKIIRLRRNFGKSAALEAGFRLAKGELIVTLDADLQDQPREVTKLLDCLDEGYDLVSGWKFPRRDSWPKRWMSRFFNFLTSVLTGVRLHDINSGLKAYRREVIQEIRLYGEMHRYIPVLARHCGFSIGEVQVDHRARVHGKSKYGVGRLLGGFFDLLSVVILTRYNGKPLHVFGISGILFLAVGLVILGYLTVGWFYGTWIEDRPVLILGVLLLIVGVQSISFGLLAEMIVYSSRRVDDYSVQEVRTVNSGETEGTGHIPFHELAADHFLYFPLVGIALCFGVAMFQLRSGGLAVLSWGLVGLIMVVFATMTVHRNRDWKTPQTLWEATLQAAPGSYRANTNLGLLYHREGQKRLGIKLTRKSLELDPSKSISWNNLGTMYYLWGQEIRRKGKLYEALVLEEQAVEHLEKAIELDPRDAFTYSNLGNCYKDMALIWEEWRDLEKTRQLRDTAVGYYMKGLQIGPNNMFIRLIWFNLGMVFKDAGHHDRAIHYLKNAVEDSPNYFEAQYWMGFCHFQEKRYLEGISYLEEAVRLKPELDAWELLAQSYERLGENRQAIQIYLRAQQQFPRSVEIHYNLGLLYHRIGDRERCKRFLESALRLDPNSPLLPDIQNLLAMVNKSWMSVPIQLQLESKDRSE